MKPQRVLVATDMSMTADEALRQAHERAQSAGALLMVCHVVPEPRPVNPLFPAWTLIDDLSFPQLREQLLDTVTERVTAVTGLAPGAFEVVIDEGEPYAGIIKRAKTWDADLLVVGSHGRAEGRRRPLGSVAQRVLRYAHCPVLVARPQSRSGQVVVGTDFSDPALPAVAMAIEEARSRQARLTIVHCVDVQPACLYYTSIGVTEPAMVELAMPPERSAEVEAAAERQLADALKRFGANGTLKVCWGPAGSCLVEIARDLDADLLVTGTAGRTGLQHVLLGSVAEEVAVTAGCSVLVVRLST